MCQGRIISMNRRWAAALFVLIFILASVNFVFWAEQREGYHCDELWSHGLANSTFHYEVFDESGAIKWNTAADYDAYMTVAKDGRFDYLGVYYNQMTDVHPPLFYAIMHTAASFFPGSASIYFCSEASMRRESFSWRLSQCTFCLSTYMLSPSSVTI